MKDSQTTPSFTIFDDYRPMVTVTVVVRWLLLVAWLTINNYRVDYSTIWLTFNLMGGALAVVNGYMTWLILARRPITWLHALSMSAIDLTLITAALFLDDGFHNRYYVFYYPALLGFSLMFPRRASFSVLAIVIILYVSISLTISPKLDLDEKDEKILFIRIITMVGIVAAGTLITGWVRWTPKFGQVAKRESRS